uniref:C2H2-type domain-containing protein n=1 Tax=Glossina austeni TaxID=7395 RepID=A0A1A9V7G8_GLOAU
MMEDITKNIIFTNAIGANVQPATIQYQTADGTILKQPKIEGQKDQPTFYYTTTNGNAATVNLAQLTTDDNKTCYIAQPVGGYNFALVNSGMQLNQGGTFGIATVDAQGRLQIVNQNKPIATFLQPVKRKAVKAVRCDSCIQGEQAQQALAAANQGTTPFLVTPDGEIKFEMNELPSGNSESSMDSLNAQNMLQNQLQPVQILSANSQGQQQLQMVTNQGGGNHNQALKRESGTPNNETSPAVKKKPSSAKVTKCGKCNGSGVVFVGSGAPAHKHGSAATATIKTETPKPFTCNICGGTFSRYSSLWSHKKLHSGEKNYKCTICGLAFAKAVYLKNHARIHTGEKPYKCQTCGMQFSQSPHLKNHERTHSGERPYVCEVCDKGFARHATLWNHRRIHTGEKPYKCEICGSAFSQAAHLKNHAKVHSGEKPFKCDICSAAFADRFALKRHRGIHEKYGQTAPRQPAQAPQQQQSDQQQVVHKQEMPDMDDDAQHETLTSNRTRNTNSHSSRRHQTSAGAATANNSYHHLHQPPQPHNNHQATTGLESAFSMKVPNYHTTTSAPSTYGAHNIYYSQQAHSQAYAQSNVPNITDVLSLNATASGHSAYMSNMMNSHHHKDYWEIGGQRQKVSEGMLSTRQGNSFR